MFWDVWQQFFVSSAADWLAIFEKSLCCSSHISSTYGIRDWRNFDKMPKQVALLM
jgi:hypothetical protein